MVADKVRSYFGLQMRSSFQLMLIENHLSKSLASSIAKKSAHFLECLHDINTAPFLPPLSKCMLAHRNDAFSSRLLKL